MSDDVAAPQEREQHDQPGHRQHDERGPRDGARGVEGWRSVVSDRLGEGHGVPSLSEPEAPCQWGRPPGSSCDVRHG